ncbi:unnamed protein product [Heligmosomoides polygyrus]|uniref:Uncharacterized protein n=1 Tax=Heligmosomoides polygyrus TaxID=6339 RepID=A0A183GGG8_HELPZ|nr:unnamed protein product [Heligmosomoides polygyrus]
MVCRKALLWDGRGGNRARIVLIVKRCQGQATSSEEQEKEEEEMAGDELMKSVARSPRDGPAFARSMAKDCSSPPRHQFPPLSTIRRTSSPAR